MDQFLILLPFLISIVAIGALAGFLAGMLGIGGGIVLVPAFFYGFSAFGFDGPDLMHLCLGTSLATIVVTSLRSMHGHAKKKAVDWAILRQWSPPIAIGAIVGVLVSSELSSMGLQLVFGFLGGFIGIYMLWAKADLRVADTMPGLFRTWIYAPVLGVLSVLLGIGGGSLGVPTMTLHNVQIHRAVATASGFGLAIAVPSVLGLLMVTLEGPMPPFTIGAVNVPIFLIIISLTFLTTPFGVAMSHRLDPKPLKRIFGVFLLIVSGNMFITAL